MHLGRMPKRCCSLDVVSERLPQADHGACPCRRDYSKTLDPICVTIATHVTIQRQVAPHQSPGTRVIITVVATSRLAEYGCNDKSRKRSSSPKSFGKTCVLRQVVQSLGMQRQVARNDMFTFHQALDLAGSNALCCNVHHPPLKMSSNALCRCLYDNCSKISSSVDACRMQPSLHRCPDATLRQ